MNYRKSLKVLVFGLIALMLVIGATNCAPKPAEEGVASLKSQLQRNRLRKSRWLKKPASRFSFRTTR